jgi:hypothetical protein
MTVKELGSTKCEVCPAVVVRAPKFALYMPVVCLGNTAEEKTFIKSAIYQPSTPPLSCLPRNFTIPARMQNTRVRQLQLLDSILFIL